MDKKQNVEIFKQLTPEELIQQALLNKEGQLATNGAFVAETGKYTGRSPKDKFIVQDEVSGNTVHWGKVNQGISEEHFEHIYQKVKDKLKETNSYEFNGYIGTHPTYRLPVQVITEYAWHNLFAHQMLVRPTKEELKEHVAEFTVIDLPSLTLEGEKDGVYSEAFIITSLKEKVVLIGGTQYAGEIKKSLFGVMNYMLPFQGILPMHCGANMTSQGETALFFGLSGTGKTTLSSAEDCLLIGDDEHAWYDGGVFNLEGGCYAKTVSLEEKKEPAIFRAITHGAVLENVTLKENGDPDYFDISKTENTRAAYPMSHIPRTVASGVGNVPKTIFFLTADAYGVLPPISKLDNQQAMDYFYNGYTSKVAGTEQGIKEPTSTFSACFGEPFLPLNPKTYVTLFGEKIKEHDVDVYLINTGWSAGGYGKSERIPLKYTRTMVQAALTGALKEVAYSKEPVFDLAYPKTCPGVPDALLNPRSGWESEEVYEVRAHELKGMFEQNAKRYNL